MVRISFWLGRNIDPVQVRSLYRPATAGPGGIGSEDLPLVGFRAPLSITQKMYSWAPMLFPRSDLRYGFLRLRIPSGASYFRAFPIVSVNAAAAAVLLAVTVSAEIPSGELLRSVLLP